ncbi:MAG TPA: hypothetical protein PLW35_06095 [Verrucomicrobiota bacterium]|nr:hypothetical protein [Verrucomicrobiota bacterium]
MKEILINNALTFLLLLTAFVGVFLQAAWDFPRNLLGVPLNLLPPLMVFAAFRTGVTTISLLAGLGGLFTDALSANPLGVSMLPLLWVGLAIHHWRELILQEFAYARFIVGLIASAAAPLLTLMIIMTLGKRTLAGWAFVWQWMIMALTGGLLTPLSFWLLDAAAGRLVPSPVIRPSFRPDREIKRGRY